MWYNHFKTLSQTPIGKDSDCEVINDVNEVLDNIDDYSKEDVGLLDDQITDIEVASVCTNLKCGKAGHHFLVQNEHFKDAGFSLFKVLPTLFNFIIQCEDFEESI